MPTSWGCNLATGTPTPLSIASDVACPAGAPTTVLTSGFSFVVISNTGVSVLAFANLAIAIGATAPSAIVVSLANVAGVPLAQFNVAAAALVASATINVPVLLSQIFSLAYVGPTGAFILIQVNPTGQAVTVRAIGSTGFAFLPPA
ncbi:MAG: hypothetical protein ACREQ5_07050 [Candidatus Dormibacteria bacterium]